MEPLGGKHTPETIARQKRLAEILARQSTSRAPQNLGEGLSALGKALGARNLLNQAEEREAAGREGANAAFDSLFSGDRVEGPGGIDARALQAAGNPFLTPGQQSVMNALIQQDLASQGFERESAEFDRRQGLKHDQGMAMLGARNAFTAEQNALDRSSAETVANTRRAGQGKFYAVQTGSGTMLVDKGSGQAVMLGIDESGSPVQIGQPFTPSLDQNGQPLPVPQGAAIDEAPTAQPIPTEASDAGDVQPLLAPSIDPAAQAAVTAAKAEAGADVERSVNRPKVEAAFNDFKRQAQIVDESIERAIGQSGTLTTGFGSLTSSIPGTPAHDLLNTLNTIQANVGFDKLQAMRDNSPTGGALGQVSEFENRLLQSVKGALQQSQSQDQLVQNLRSVQEDYKALLAERERALATDFQADSSAPVEAAAPRRRRFNPETGRLE